jgi:hypothetical protein
MRDAEFDRSFDRASYAFHALPMAFGTREPALGGPAAVTVHDDGNMANGRPVGPLPSELIHRKRHVRLLRVGGNGGCWATAD